MSTPVAWIIILKKDNIQKRSVNKMNLSNFLTNISVLYFNCKVGLLVSSFLFISRLASVRSSLVMYGSFSRARRWDLKAIIFFLVCHDVPGFLRVSPYISMSSLNFHICYPKPFQNSPNNLLKYLLQWQRTQQFEWCFVSKLFLNIEHVSIIRVNFLSF